MTYGEAMQYDVGFLQYLWYIGLKNAKSKEGEAKAQNEAMEDAFKGDL